MLRRHIYFSVLILVLLSGFMSSNLNAQVGQKPPALGIPQSPSLVGDTSALAREAQDWLVELIKINTSNPPGNEQVAAKYIAGILAKEGISAEILDLAPGRSAVVARLRSSIVADPSKALLLVAHMDVVGVDRAKWSVDPFGGVIKDGYLWGRGSLDDKSMLAANLAAFIALKRGSVHLNRDVIFLGTTDEEQFGDASMKMIIAKYWDKIASGFALNEGGKVLLDKSGKVQYVALQASEKVSVNVTLTVTGKGGHASTPTKDNPVVHLAAAVEKIGNYNTPVHLNSIVRRYFEALAPLEDEETSKWMKVIDTSDRGEHAQRYLAEANPMWNSMMRDTIAPTILQAGFRGNVIPSEAHAVLNIRLVPGDTIDVLVNDLKKLVNDPQVHFEIAPEGGLAAPNSSLENDFFNLITRVCAREFGGVPVIPFMSTGATDSAQLRLHSVQAYGLRPFPINEADDARVHGDEERLPLGSFPKGVDLMVRIVAEFSVSR
ncbi:MAG TPA: M20/M25/M40 family metallo-hydrolase [Candidatus Limnocylindrales bacterium]|nr:M20/M25/M40 family metallo-hydrolase [Candidatus Limnocylindrales bacterium]